MYVHFLHLSMLVLWGACLGARPAFGQAAANGAAPVAPLTLSPAFDGAASLGRFAPLSLALNRPLQEGEGRLAVFIGTLDVTPLLERDGAALRYTPTFAPLPSGRSEVIAYLIPAEGSWRELGRYPLHVRLPGGFDQARLDPGLTLNNKGQLAEGTFPAPEQEPDHRIYQDFSGQLDVQSELTHSGWTQAAQGQVVGVSYRNKALRFGELQEEAPRIDLARYHVQMQRGPVRLEVGHLAHGRHRHLINAFGSRGLSAGLSYGNRVDLSLAALNGTRLVGWGNVLGVDEPDHRLVSGTLGFEVLKHRPGGLRLEGSYLDGSVLPRTGFNQAGVPDAAKSRGGGARLLAHTPGQRFRVEAGYAGSRYTNPFDPTLAQGDPLVPVRETTNYAHYVEAAAGLVQNALLAPRFPLNVRAVYRRERVEPLYQTVAAFIQADRVHNTFEVQGGLGAASLQFSHSRSENNLDEVPSILKTQTRQHQANLGLPLRSLVGGNDGKGFGVLPFVSYSFNQTHQFSDALPENGGFSPSHLPDQMNRIHNAALGWQGTRWRLDYRFSNAFQDNRQEGREDADFLNRSETISISFDPSFRFGVGLDFSLERTENRAEERIDRTHRVGLRTALRPVDRLTFSGSFAPTLTKNDARTLRSSNANLSLEGAYAFQFDGGLRGPVRGRVFLRYARRASTLRNTLFDLDTENRAWTVNSGVTLTLF